MNTLIDGTPSTTPMGIRLYGSEYPGKDEATGCKDTELISPVGELDAAAKTAVKKKIAATEPTGFTPIGHSLRKAAEDLKAKAGDGAEGGAKGGGELRIILVSDGEDTCAPPEPCEVAEELAKDGVDLVIDTLGFKVTGKAAEQLKCVARATKGTYRGAEDAGELSAGLQGALKDALKGYPVSGTPIKGGQGCASAPMMKPGQYVDRYRTGETRWYRVGARPGQSVRFSATWITEAGKRQSGYGVTVTLLPKGSRNSIDNLGHKHTNGMYGMNIVSVGVASERLPWTLARRGEAEAVLCVRVANEARSENATEPMELKFGLAGKLLTRADLKDPKDLKDSDDGTVVERRGRGDGDGDGDGASDAATKPEPSSPESAATASASASSGVASPAVLVLLAVLGVGVGLLVRRFGAARGRRS
jgi:Ca-activated chloride channel family protein